MTWIYDPIKQTSTNTETGDLFLVRGDDPQNFDVVDVNGGSLNLSEMEMERVRKGVSEAIKNEIVRHEMRNLIREHFQDDCLEAANVISKQSGKKVSQRTIQTWLIDPEKVSSRTCQPWALKTLKDYISNNPKSTFSTVPDSDLGRALKTVNSKTVELATSSIESDEKKRREWERCSLGELHNKIFELEKRHEEHLWHLNAKISGLESALTNSSDFKEMKAKFRDKDAARSVVRDSVRETRMDIESGAKEFSIVDGEDE